jgi:RNA-directed DNA polymerase
VTNFLRRTHHMWPSTYVLKADIQSYFASVNHEVLRGLIRKRIACRETLWLTNKIIDSWKPHSGTGIPIGNLSSQLFANVYLHELDKYIKHALRESFYVRYMDDFVALSPDKAHLNALQHRVGAFLNEQLRLRLNRKTRIFPAECGIDFLGYKIWRTHRLLRKSSIRRMRRRFAGFRAGRVSPDEMRATVASWIGHCQHASTYTLRKRVLGGY